MKFIQLVSILLALGMLFQGCKAYDFPTTVNFAEEKQPWRVKIKTKYGEKHKFTYFRIKEDTVYGFNHYELTGKIAIEDIIEVQLVNKPGSVMMTIVAISTGAFFIVGIPAIFYYGM